MEPSNERVLAVGCFDSSGKTGLIRDYLAARSMGAPAILVPTAIAVEGADGPQLDVRPVANLLADVEAAMPRVAAIKVGLLGSPELVVPLARTLERFRGPVVYDPVLRDPGGAALAEGTLEVLQPMIAQVTLLSPDVTDATHLTGLIVGDYESARRAATVLRARGAAAVLIKGATLPNESVDVLAGEEGEAHFSTSRREGPLPRGTGSAMATAISVGLARGLSLRGAVREGHRWLHGRLAAAGQARRSDWI